MVESRFLKDDTRLIHFQNAIGQSRIPIEDAAFTEFPIEPLSELGFSIGHDKLWRVVIYPFGFTFLLDAAELHLLFPGHHFLRDHLYKLVENLLQFLSLYLRIGPLI